MIDNFAESVALLNKRFQYLWRDSRPLDDWVGETISFEGMVSAVKPGWFCLEGMQIWKWDSKGYVRNIDHMWFEDKGKKADGYVAGMGKIKPYTRKNGTKDLGIELVRCLTPDWEEKIVKTKEFTDRLWQYKAVVRMWEERLMWVPSTRYGEAEEMINFIREVIVPTLERNIEINAIYSFNSRMNRGNKPAKHSWMSANKKCNNVVV